MKKNTLAFLLLLLIFPAAGVHAQNGYLQNAFQSAGGGAMLSNISDWRQREKKAILSGIADLPEHAKQDLVRAADGALKQNWTAIRLSDYAEFKENGNRVNFEHLYLSRRSKLSVLCAGELVTGKGKYLPEIIDGIWLMLEESTWVLPAHLYTKQVNFPDPSSPVIDLFAAETAAHLAWVKLLLGEELVAVSPVLTKRISEALQTRLLQPYLATNNYWWMGLKNQRKQNNWNIWINSNVLKVAALTEDDAELRIALITKVIRSADQFIDDYPADGGCDEGPAYWSAAGGCLGEFLAVLNRISSGKLDWSKNALFKNIGTYIYKVHIAGDRFVNFADAPGAILPDPGRVYNFGEMFDDDQMKHFAAYLGSISGGPSGYLRVGSIVSFANNVRVSKALSAITPIAPLPMQNWLPDLQIVNLRAKEGDTDGLTFMAKGGNNGESHNHNDVGNFMVYKDGDPVLIDLGKGTYTKQTFSPDRYKLWYTQSQWHNCPVINGTDQQAKEIFLATAVKFTKGKAADVFTMDLAKAYPTAAAVKSWIREFNYNREKQELILKDSYQLSGYHAASSLSFVACRLPVKEKPGIIRLSSISGKLLSMSYDPKLLSATIEEQVVDDTSIAGVWGKSVYRIKLTTIGKKLKGEHTIRIR